MANGRTTARRPSELLDAIEAGAIHPRVPDARVPRWLAEVVRKGLADDPDQRYRDMAELLRALKDEPPDDAAATDEPDDDDDSLEHEGPVLHVPATPAGAAAQRDRWPIGVIGLLSALLLGMGVNVLMRSPAPEPAAGMVEAEAYTVILGLIAADTFTEAQQMWSDHASELSGEQSLQIARDWLSRARQQARDDRMQAQQTALAAFDVADHVAHYSSTPEMKKAGGQLAAEAKIYGQVAADDFVDAQERGSLT